MSGVEFQEARLGNGLTVIGERNPAARSVAVGYFVRTGSRDETPDVAGVSHFLEHMLFKGSETLSAWDINRLLDELGARSNAFTSEEVTAYHGAVLPERQAGLLGLLTRMMRPALREDDFEVERQVILEEIEMYADQPASLAFEALREAYFAGHPLGHSVLGTAETVGALEREKMLAYFERRYAPDNLTLALAGAYDWDAALEAAGRLTAGWAPAGAGRDHPPFEPGSGVRTLEHARFNRAHLAAMAPGHASADPLHYAAGVLAVALGDAEGSRLYWSLVHGGLCETASLDHGAEDGLGAFSAYAVTDPARAQEALDRLRETLLAAQAEGLRPDELERAKRKVAVSQVLRAETPYGRLFPLALEYLDARRHV